MRDRAFQPDADLNRLLAFLSARGPRGFAEGYLHVGDVCWRLPRLAAGEAERHLRLWETADGDLAGFAWFDPPAAVDIQVAPDHRGRLEPAMAAWAEAQLRAGADGQTPALAVWAADSDVALRGYLAAHGYVEIPPRWPQFALDLTRLPARAAIEPAVAVRPTTEAERAARVALHRAAWHPSRFTAEAYAAVRATPCYRPDLDLVAVATDGALAAYCICWLDPITGVAEFEPVGTDPAYRRRGLAAALLRGAFRRLIAAGAHTAIVITPESNAAAHALYTAVGFDAVTCIRAYRR